MLRLIDIAIENGGIGVDAAVAIVGPVAAIVVALVEVELLHVECFFFMGGLIEDAAECIGNETATPELHAAFQSGAVDADDGNPIGNGMAALDGLPGFILLAVVLFALAYVPAYGGGEEKQLGTHEAGDAGGFGIPLVPADEYAEGSITCLEDFVSEVAGGEIEFLVVARVVGDMHFAVFAKIGAIGIDDGGGIVVEAFGSFLKEGADEYYAQLFGQGHKVLAGWTLRDRLCEEEILVAFLVAKVKGDKKFLEADDLGTVGGELTHLVGVALDVLLFVGHIGQLGNSHLDFHVDSNLDG